jgi:hypothetical protein
MRASNSSSFPIGVALGLLSLSFLSGCHKEVKADFPRPPATATMAPPAPQDPPAKPEPVLEEPAPPPEPDSGETPANPAPSSTETPRPRPKRPPEAAVEPPPAPPSTQLADTGKSDLDPELAKKLERASFLLGSVSGRTLTPELTEQLTASRAFVAQARQALAEGDERRALILIDKGLILAEDVERLSRP